MADYGGARQLLPQGPRTFEFANVQPDNRDKQKSERLHSAMILEESTSLIVFLDYVFVDEHNRHRRLKGTVAPVSCIFLSLLIPEISHEGLWCM